MGKPLHYVYYTAAGALECVHTEEEIRAHRAFTNIERPAEGRPRYAGALYFMIQETLDKAQDKEWFSIIDIDGNMTTLRPSAIYGYRVLESLAQDGETAEPQIGFRQRD